MVDGVLLLVDASRGPAAPDALRAAQGARVAPAGDPRGQQGRPRPTRASPRSCTRSRSCSSTSTPRSTSSTSRSCTASRRRSRLARSPGRRRRARPRTPTCGRCSTCSSSASPRPCTTRRCRCRRWSPTSTRRRTSGGSRCAACTAARSARARRSRGAAASGEIERVKVTELYVTDALERVPADEAGPGEIVAVAGIDDITIGETLADRRRPAAAPGDHDRRAEPVDDRRHQHLAARRSRGTSAHRAAREEPARPGARRQRLDPRAADRAPRLVGGAGPGRAAARRAGRDDAARGFRADRRQARVLTREIDGTVHEPVDRLTIDVPEEYLGVVTQLLALRKGRMEQIVNHGTGWVRMEYVDPARGLIGFRTEFVTETRRHRAAPPRVRAHGAVGGRDPPSAQRLTGRRPRWHHHIARAARAAGPRRARSSVPASTSTRAW